MSFCQTPIEAAERFEFRQTVGRGSSGKVKLASDHLTKELVAIKIVKRHVVNTKDQTVDGKGYSTEQEFIKEKIKQEIREARTIREAHIMKLLHHPHIVQLKDLYVTPHFFYITMEYVEGGQLLHHIVSRGKLSESEARRFSRQIISALDYMHRNSIVHRDLKIENILLDREARNIKVVDFGLSNLYCPERRLKTFCGSLYFAAPEVIVGQPYRGPEIDVWSLGVVIYVMVTGSVPFDDPSLTGLHAKIKRADVRFPTYMSSACKDLLQRIFVVDRKKRVILADVIRHPWIQGHVQNYLPLRMPLTLPLVPGILKRMTAGFRLGSAEEIEEKMQTIVQSPIYRFAAEHVARLQLAKLRGLEETATMVKKWGTYDDPQTIPSAYHPLCSIYYLTKERCQEMKRSDIKKNKEMEKEVEQIERVVEKMDSREEEEDEEETGFKHIVASISQLISKISCQPPQH
ncbi:hypothetical protein G6F57_007265 [Rhizopus arrhizus]|uniref:Protein kinase domain-containing protein n=1 Tax=Rhizopus oryzae TaxID=64495 RepID=A0A9P6XFK0_RHIOR|nr:hypothetical protein G6F24_006907 [Rhizopus arrhizus]KAG1422312.1 hypothetical protein G6F58_003368 [Rhizopus delemar]KAG0778767.1 hypothetical protein G6F22_011038 [Rhizopus arrhizus]KAG0788770.1 hypothetical protein G6F21_006985 [Rhizopus arrhizus]KAG0813964.1 hypothetical protein G6F20_005143 [Rhizopus arrhizus]